MSIVDLGLVQRSLWGNHIHRRAPSKAFPGQVLCQFNNSVDPNIEYLDVGWAERVLEQGGYLTQSDRSSSRSYHYFLAGVFLCDDAAGEKTKERLPVVG